MENTCNDLINYGKIKSKYKINQRWCWRMDSNWYPSAAGTKARVEATQGRSWEPAAWHRTHIWLWVSGVPRSLGAITRDPQHDTVVDLFIYLFSGGGGNLSICLKFSLEHNGKCRNGAMFVARAANKNNTSTSFIRVKTTMVQDFFLSGKRHPCPSLSVELPLKVLQFFVIAGIT